MLRCLLLVVCAVVVAMLAACASTPSVAVASDNAGFLHDDAFGEPSTPIDAASIFALDEPMRAYITSMRALDKADIRTLVTALYSRRQLKLQYDTEITRTASQAFEARSGNCLSLVIMTAAFAKAMGLEVHYQSAMLDETWSRNGAIYFSSGHVNITLGHALKDRKAIYETGNSVTVDFLPAAEIEGMRTKPIDESTVVAMYMNNRAAESLASGHVDDAYAWAREALRQAPGFMPAFNTLGVVYLQRAMPAEAQAVFAHVLATDAADASALSNSAASLRLLGRTDEANAMMQRLAQVEPSAPFAWFNRGMIAMQDGDWHTARDMFAKEVDRAGYYHEFQYWLGMADLRMGDLTEARKHLQLALDASTTAGAHDIYAAKLERINAGTQVH